MRTRLVGIGLALAAALASGCAAQFTAPPKSAAQTPIAVLPPANQTGDPLLVAGGSFLEKYAFKTEEVTVPEVLLAETRTVLERRGFSVVSGDAVAAALHGRSPTSAADAAALAARGGLQGDALFFAIRQWTADDSSTPRAVIASVEATLVDVQTGATLWQANWKPRPVQTLGAINVQTAYVIAVQKLVAELFAGWETMRGG